MDPMGNNGVEGNMHYSFCYVEKSNHYHFLKYDNTIIIYVAFRRPQKTRMHDQAI